MLGLVAGAATFQADPRKPSQLLEDRPQHSIRFAENVGIGHKLRISVRHEALPAPRSAMPSRRPLSCLVLRFINSFTIADGALHKKSWAVIDRPYSLGAQL